MSTMVERLAGRWREELLRPAQRHGAGHPGTLRHDARWWLIEIAEEFEAAGEEDLALRLREEAAR